MRLAYLSFTDRGEELARKLAEQLGGSVSRCGRGCSLSGWTERQFQEAEGLVFIGAVGIAVRAAAPYLRGKDKDPAVVAVDETGRYAVPILSGHLGGANELAQAIAGVCGAEAVITTATDRNGVFAIDLWAKRQNCALEGVEEIKKISGKLLSGGEIRIKSRWPVAGTPPQGVTLTEGEERDATVSIFRRDRNGLWLIPRAVVLGIGCRKNTPAEKLEAALKKLLEETGISEKALCLAVSIDLKQEEPGILEFCRDHGLPFRCFSAEELAQAEGDFSASAFVAQVTGVDNVCERSVVRCGGKLLRKKLALDGVTMALGIMPFAPDWRWRNG